MSNPRVLKVVSWILLAFALFLLFVGYQNHLMMKSMRGSPFIGGNEEIMAHFELINQGFEKTINWGIVLLFFSIIGFCLAWWNKKKIAIKSRLNFVNLVDKLGKTE